MISLSKYLLQYNFKYVLTGPLEGRFGWWRQSCGGNYYASVNQFLNADKSMRSRSLIKLNKLTVKEIREAFAENNNSRICAKNKAKLLLDSLSNVKDICRTDLGLIYYIAGFVARKVCNMAVIKSCLSCQSLVKISNEELKPSFNTVDNDDLHVEESTSNHGREFLLRFTRGGLIESSDLLFVTIKEFWSLYSSIFDSADAKSLFLSFSHRF